MTITVKTLKVQKLRNNEYYGIQSVLDNLYKNSENGAIIGDVELVKKHIRIKTEHLN